MEFPELYRKVSFLSKRDASLILEEFTNKKRWRENARVIDIGCGDGSTTKEVLQKFLPASYKQVIGSDISQKMVEYAKENFTGEKFEFTVWDVSKEVPAHMKSAFDHVFSFYTLNRVKQKEAAFLNIYDILADGGNCLLMFIGRYAVYDVFRTLSRTKKWAEDLKDVEIFTSPYHDLQEPEIEVSRLMESVGFKDVQVKSMNYTHTYETEVFAALVKAVNPFDILNERWDEFMKDYFEVAPNGRTLNYHLIVAYGSK